MKLGRRLQALYQALPGRYEQVWDCCCDHGFLGLALLETGKAGHLTLVDQLPGLAAPLQALMADQDPQRYRIRITDAASLTLTGCDSELVIVAGVGPDTLLSIVAGLCRGNDCRHSEFLLSPNGDILRVRQGLQALGFALLAEGFVSERRRGYPWLRVTLSAHAATSPLSLLGEHWDLSRPDQRHYLNQLQGHYRRRLRNPGQRQVAGEALAACEALLTAAGRYEAAGRE
ncbi:MAG: tRNA (adenine(22)-N(1))-methyltransferase TrmK [Oleiphilaceae bacterium]|nr:tRNA (adenine(22)-N(1))-methyltransferase TrmK [Oleiphilaceae bacterium]